MAKQTKNVNAGVHSATGFTFQKHCALFVFLKNYENLKDKLYFISLEQEDDFLFCFHADNGDISLIDCYQAKKSSDKWGFSAVFYEILQKISDAGNAFLAYSIPKTKDYNHSLNFITNSYIYLLIKGKSPKGKNKVKVPDISDIVNEANEKVKYINLKKEIKDKLDQEVSKLLQGAASCKELDNLTLVYLDTGKTSETQRDQIKGLFGRVFGNKVNDEDAAIETLLRLFREVEERYNQGNIVDLLDTRKRIKSSEINNAIEIITTKSKAYELWRGEKNGIAAKLNIAILDRGQFESNFENSFDLFKDLTQTEHQKILKFVTENKSLLSSYTDETECVSALFQKFNSGNNSNLMPLQIKAAIFAAYIEIRET